MPETDWQRIAQDHYGSFPHPLAPSLTVKDFPMAVQLATATKFGGHASPQEAALFWSEFQALQMQPGEYLDTLQKAAPLSFRFVGRPPTMQEIKMHSQAAPDQIHKYYSTLPDKDYPELMAGQMVKALATAEPYAQKHLGRSALKVEGQFIHNAALNAPAVDAHYAYLAADRQQKEGGDETRPIPSSGETRSAPSPSAS